MSDLYQDQAFLEQIIRALYRSQRFLDYAIQLGIKPEDFGTLRLYRLFVTVILELKGVVSDRMVLTLLATKRREFEMSEDVHINQIVKFQQEIFSAGEIPETEYDYLKRVLPDFVRFRRFQLIQDQTTGPVELVQQAKELVEDIELRTQKGVVEEYSPFEELTFVNRGKTLMTGFDPIDQVTGGLGEAEFGMLLAHTGSGKTAMATFLMIQNLKDGNRVAFVSLEEAAKNINNRFYSNVFRIDAKKLKQRCPLAEDELRRAHANMDPVLRRQFTENLRVFDFREAAPVTPTFIKNFFEDYYNRHGWVPDIIVIDQLDFLIPSEAYKDQWQRYEKATFEVEWLTNQKIAGQFPITVWLLHQVHGAPKRKFTNAEIAGYKGVLKCTDMALALGRDSMEDTVVSIFSLKCRHAENFQFDFLADLKYMNFEEIGHADREKIEKEHRDKKKQTRESSKKDSRYDIQKPQNLNRLPMPLGVQEGIPSPVGVPAIPAPTPPTSILPPPGGGFI